MKLIKSILQLQGNSWCRVVRSLNCYCVHPNIREHLRLLSIMLAAIIILFPFPTFAQGKDGKQSKSTDLIGIKFGIGLTLTKDIGPEDRVEEAELVNGIVRIAKQRNDIPRVLLETHIFFDKKTWGWGPFVGIQTSSDEVVEAVGGGLMVGLRRNDSYEESFNLGLGVIVDPSVKVLGDGIKKNEPLPAGETQIRYKDTSQWGILFIFSYSWD